MSQQKNNLTVEPDNTNFMESEPSETSVQEKENNSNSGEIIRIDKQEGTPFTIIDIEEGSFIAIGNKRITEIIHRKEAEKKIKTKDWNIIMALVLIMTENIKEETKL